MIASTITHPKFLALQRTLDRPIYECVGLLETLWMLAALHADDGDLTKFTSNDIASFVGWQEASDELIDALVTHRWLDRDASGLRIHDWDQNCPSYIHDRRRKRSQRKGRTVGSKLSQDIPGHSAKAADSPDKSEAVRVVPGQSVAVRDAPGAPGTVPGIPGQSGSVLEGRPRIEQSRTEENNQSLGVDECLVASLVEIGITNPEDHVRAALTNGKSNSDLHALIDEYKRRQSQPSPPRPPLLACWLKGTKPWPFTKLPPPEPYHRVKQPLEVHP